jgi:hypothetical protein
MKQVQSSPGYPIREPRPRAEVSVSGRVGRTPHDQRLTQLNCSTAYARVIQIESGRSYYRAVENAYGRISTPPVARRDPKKLEVASVDLRINGQPVAIEPAMLRKHLVTDRWQEGHPFWEYRLPKSFSASFRRTHGSGGMCTESCMTTQQSRPCQR